MSKSLISLLFLSVLLAGCSGSSSDVEISATEDPLIASRIGIQNSRIKSMDGFNQLNTNLINDSFNMLSKVEIMLKGMSDNRDVLIDVIQTLTEPFAITTNEPITVDSNVSSSTPPFAIGAAGLSNHFLLLSSSSRFLTPENSIKTRFKTPTELSDAWLRAVEFSDQTCVYVALQSVDAAGAVTNASNTLVVPLVSADQCSVQL